MERPPVHPRRDFLGRTLALVPWALSAGFAWPVGRFLLFGEAERQKLTLPLSQFGEGITPLPAARLFVVRRGDTITVFDAHCTHMGCLLHYDADANVFNCPCHHSRFAGDGRRLRGPAKRDLDTIAYTRTATSLVIG